MSGESLEHTVGVVSYTNEDIEGFQGIHKQRYSDFVVREVIGGQVCMLSDVSGLEIEKKLFHSNVADGIFKDEKKGDKATIEQKSSSVELDLNSLFKDMEAVATCDETQRMGIEEFLTKCAMKDEECADEFLCDVDCSEKSVRTALHQLFRKYASKQVRDMNDRTLEGYAFIPLLVYSILDGSCQRSDVALSHPAILLA